MLEVQHIVKAYGKQLAVNDVSFSIPDGEIAVLLGPNGAGKSTLIKSMAGLLRFKGEVLVNGNNNKTVQARRDLGYVPEMPAVYDLLTVQEHMEFIARAYKLENWEGFSDELLARLEMADKKSKLGKELSKGMQQKLSIACAMLPKPQVMVLDEPLVGLDPHAIKELKEMLHEWRDAGHTLLLSTHMIESVEHDWDCAYILMKGQLKAVMRREEETESDTLEKLFFRITEGEVTEQ